MNDPDQQLYKYGVLYKKSSILKRWDKRSATIDFRLSMLSLKKNNTEKHYKLTNYSIIWMGKAYDHHQHTFQLNSQNIKKREPLILGDKHQGNALDWYIHIKNSLIRQQYIDYGISQDFKHVQFKPLKMNPFVIEEENSTEKQLPYFKPITNCYSKTSLNLNFQQLSHAKQSESDQQIIIQICKRFGTDINAIVDWLSNSHWIQFKKSSESVILQKEGNLKFIGAVKFQRKEVEACIFHKSDKKEIYWNKNVISIDVIDVQVLKRIQLKNCSSNLENSRVKLIVKDVKQKMFTTRDKDYVQIILQDDQLLKDDMVIADCTYNLTEIFTIISCDNSTLIIWDLINTEYLPIEAFLPYMDQYQNLVQTLQKLPNIQITESFDIISSAIQKQNKKNSPRVDIDKEIEVIHSDEQQEDEIGYTDLDFQLSQEQILKLLEYSKNFISTQKCIQTKHKMLKSKPFEKLLSIDTKTHFCIESKGLVIDQQKGGAIYVNEKMMQEQKKVVMNMLKRMGSNLVSGKSLMSISLPVQVFSKESFIQRVARSYGYAPIYLNKLATAKSNVEIIQNIVTFFIGSFPMVINLEKPFNPILGETFQGRIGGIPIYFEQILHHPPVSYFYMEGKGFKMYGPHSPQVNMSANSLTGEQLGNPIIEVKDTKFYFIQHSFQLDGVAMGKKVISINSKSYCFEPKSQIVCETVYNPHDPGFFSGYSHKIDEVQGSIFKTSKEKIVELLKLHKWKKQSNSQKITFDPKKDIFQLYSKLSGRWTQNIEFDGQIVWDLYKNAPYAVQLVDYPLPSDSRYRQDLLYFMKGDIEKAQDLKEQMEEDQRKDNKLRDKK